VVIQHDDASCHIEGNDVQFDQAAKQGVWDICLEKQPAKSPNTNVLDLSFFRALQAKQKNKKNSRSILRAAAVLMTRRTRPTRYDTTL
jgi:hypothetical protein